LALEALADILADLGDLLVVDDGADVGLLVHRIADPERGGLLLEPGEEGVEDVLVQEHARPVGVVLAAACVALWFRADAATERAKSTTEKMVESEKAMSVLRVQVTAATAVANTLLDEREKGPRGGPAECAEDAQCTDRSDPCRAWRFACCHWWAAGLRSTIARLRCRLILWPSCCAVMRSRIGRTLQRCQGTTRDPGIALLEQGVYAGRDCRLVVAGWQTWWACQKAAAADPAVKCDALAEITKALRTARNLKSST
jgi:hypothetical protein